MVFEQMHPGEVEAKVGAVLIAVSPMCPMLQGKHSKSTRQRRHPLAGEEAQASGML